MNKGLYSSNTDDWETPSALFRELDNEFHFDLDPCANEANHKCDRYFTKEDDGLLQNWGGVPSVLQSPIRTADRTLGGKSVSGKGQAEHDYCVVTACTN